MAENTIVLLNVPEDNIIYELTLEVAPKNLRLNKLLKAKISEVCEGNFKYFVKSEFEDNLYDLIQDEQQIPTTNGAVLIFLKPKGLKDYCNMDYWLSFFTAKSEIHKDKDV